LHTADFVTGKFVDLITEIAESQQATIIMAFEIFVEGIFLKKQEKLLLNKKGKYKHIYTN